MMEQLPLVSICIPNYNNEQFIGEAIQSSIDQTYPNLEIIVVDNASTDNSWKIIQGYAQHKNVKVYQNEVNLGMVGNFRRTLEHSTGELVTYLCSDDCLGKGAIAENIAILLKYPETSFVFGNVEYSGNRTGRSNLNFDELMPKGEWAQRSLEKSQNLTFLTGSIFRRSVAEKIEGLVIEDLTFFDWFLWLRLGLMPVAFNSNVVGLHRYHDANQTEVLTPGVTKNYLHLDKVLKLFKKYYPNQDGIAKAEGELSFRFARLVGQKDSLKAAIKFAREYCKNFLVSATKLAFVHIYSRVLTKK